jgi:hypothetical protein
MFATSDETRRRARKTRSRRLHRLNNVGKPSGVRRISGRGSHKAVGGGQGIVTNVCCRGSARCYGHEAKECPSALGTEPRGSEPAAPDSSLGGAARRPCWAAQAHVRCRHVPPWGKRAGNGDAGQDAASSCGGQPESSAAEGVNTDRAGVKSTAKRGDAARPRVGPRNCRRLLPARWPKAQTLVPRDLPQAAANADTSEPTPCLSCCPPSRVEPHRVRCG